jgi:hypothetical protein
MHACTWGRLQWYDRRFMLIVRLSPTCAGDVVNPRQGGRDERNGTFSMILSMVNFVIFANAGELTMVEMSTKWLLNMYCLLA